MKRSLKAVALSLTALLITSLSVLTMSAPARATTQQESIALLAAANIGKMACSTNSKGGKGFESSCTGYGGQPEYWCADFAKWVWAKNGVTGTGVLNAAAFSFYQYAQAHGGVHAKPRIGDVAIFSNNKGDRTWSDHGINHVAVVTGWSDYGAQVHTLSGDWIVDPPSGLTEPQFASRSHVVDNGEYSSAPGTYSQVMQYWIIGYVSPVF